MKIALCLLLLLLCGCSGGTRIIDERTSKDAGYGPGQKIPNFCTYCWYECAGTCATDMNGNSVCYCQEANRP